MRIVYRITKHFRLLLYVNAALYVAITQTQMTMRCADQFKPDLDNMNG